MKKIYVKPSFVQQPEDVVLYQCEEYVALNVERVTPYKAFSIEVSDKRDKEVIASLKSNLMNTLNNICDSKSRGVKFLIAGMHVSVEQMEEYALVEKAVDANNVEFFKIDAEFLGTTAQEEFDKAKKAKDSYIYMYDSAKKLIRIFRRVVASHIDSLDFVIARKMIAKGLKIGLNDDGSLVDGNPVEVLESVEKQVMLIIKNKGEITKQEENK